MRGKGRDRSPEVFQPAQSAVMVRVGNADFPVISASDCRVCSHEHRLFIERELVRGTGYAAITRQVQALVGEENPLSSKFQEWVSRHFKAGHVPERARARRMIQERRAQQMGIDILGDENIVTTLSIADTIIQRGYERMLDGEIDPDMKDLQAALKLRHEVEKAAPDGFDLEIIQQAFVIMWAEVEKRMGMADLMELGEALDRNPVLQALRQKMAQQQGMVVEGSLDDD